FANQLILAALVIDRDAATGDQCHAVGQAEFKVFRGAFEHHATELGARVLEGEIDMPRGGKREVGDLSLDPDLLEVFFQNPAQQGGQSTDGEDGFFGEDVH